MSLYSSIFKEISSLDHIKVTENNLPKFNSTITSTKINEDIFKIAKEFDFKQSEIFISYLLEINNKLKIGIGETVFSKNISSKIEKIKKKFTIFTYYKKIKKTNFSYLIDTLISKNIKYKLNLKKLNIKFSYVSYLILYDKNVFEISDKEFDNLMIILRNKINIQVKKNKVEDKISKINEK